MTSDHELMTAILVRKGKAQLEAEVWELQARKLELAVALDTTVAQEATRTAFVDYFRTELMTQEEVVAALVGA